jgi:hypothetical protein
MDDLEEVTPNDGDRFKKMTNKEFIDYLIDFGPGGVMSQVIIMLAVEHFCEEILEERIKGGPLIYKPLWMEAAKGIKELFERRHGRNGV